MMKGLFALVFVAVLAGHVDSRTLRVTSQLDCKSIYLSSNEDLDIYFNGRMSGTCEIQVDAYSLNYLCVEEKEFDISSCDVTVKYFENQWSSYSPDRTYSCSDSSASKWCPALDGSIKITFESSFSSSANIHLKVTQTDDSHIDDFVKSVVIGVYAIIGIVIGVIVLIAVVITIIVCCVCNKRRATGGTVYRGQQPATVAVPGTYPAQAAPATYPYPQPGTYPQAGYQPGIAQAGYQPPPQGYPAAPGMENKPATAPGADFAMQPVQPPPYAEN